MVISIICALYVLSAGSGVIATPPFPFPFPFSLSPPITIALLILSNLLVSVSSAKCTCLAGLEGFDSSTTPTPSKLLLSSLDGIVGDGLGDTSAFEGNGVPDSALGIKKSTRNAGMSSMEERRTGEKAKRVVERIKGIMRRQNSVMRGKGRALFDGRRERSAE